MSFLFCPSKELVPPSHSQPLLYVAADVLHHVPFLEPVRFNNDTSVWNDCPASSGFCFLPDIYYISSLGSDLGTSRIGILSSIIPAPLHSRTSLNYSTTITKSFLLSAVNKTYPLTLRNLEAQDRQGGDCNRIG